MNVNPNGTTPAISVVIPTYNGAKTIGAQLDALASQEFDFPWEVIVSDNGSTDGLAEYIVRRAEEFPVPLRIVDASQRRGVSHARNVGIRATRAERFAICDCDDVVMDGWLQAASDALDDCDFATGPMHLFSSSTDSVSEIWSGSTLPIIGGLELFGGNFSGWAREYWRIGDMDETMMRWGGEDSEFSIRVTLHGCRTMVAQQMAIYYRQPDSLQAKAKKWIQGGRNDVFIWRRYPEYFAHRLGLLLAFRRFFRVAGRMARTRSRLPALEESCKLLGSILAQIPISDDARSVSSETNGRDARLDVFTCASNARALRTLPTQPFTGIDQTQTLALSPEGEISEQLRSAGYRVLVSTFGPPASFVRSLRTLRMAIRAFRPTTVRGMDGKSDRIIRFCPLPRGTKRILSSNVAFGGD